MAPKTRLSHADYTVGWICALPSEMAASRAMMDELHDDLPVQRNDHNAYVLGRIGDHNVVIACLPSGEYGIASAATVAMQLLSSFQSIRFGLLVGIGGGVPSKTADIRLGDVVVSKPTGAYGGVIQYDYGKAIRDGCFENTGMLNRPPQILLTALAKLRANYEMEGSRIPHLLVEMGQKYPQMQTKYSRAGHSDRLFTADYMHDSSMDSCDQCDLTQTIKRQSRQNSEPVVHYGLIASGNQVVKDSGLREHLRQKFGVLCVEMEAAGLMNNYPCMVIRGICDYADSHKNKDWQEYAASVAAAYAKELLMATSVANIDQTKTIQDRLSDMHHKIETMVENQQSMCAMLAKCQSISYYMPFDTNQRLTTFQIDQVTELLSASHKFEHLKTLQLATALSKNSNQGRLVCMRDSRFWLHPRFKKWQYSSINDVVLIKGDYKSRLVMRSFCVKFIEVLLKQKSPIIWTLQARDPRDTPSGLSITDAVKSLVCQILQLSLQLQTERSTALYHAQAQAAESLTQWFDLLGKAISSMPSLYILIERNVVMESEGTDSASKDCSWLAAFLRLFDELNRRGCKTLVKVLVVIHSSYGTGTRAELRVAQTNQLMIPVYRSSGGCFGGLPSKFRRY